MGWLLIIVGLAMLVMLANPAGIIIAAIGAAALWIEGERRDIHAADPDPMPADRQAVHGCTGIWFYGTGYVFLGLLIYLLLTGAGA